mmetsp:Transcript_21477/g.62847  ORF Transcript_21477/g.62847 Transcript_21477/m.62847 type:complete len:235 (+) Transcript_21477:596-1300(+)
MEGEERRPEARRKVGRRLDDAPFGPRDLGGVAGDEMIHGLTGAELGDGGEYAEGVAREKDDVIGMSGLLRLVISVDMKDGIRDSAVLRLGHVEIIGHEFPVDFGKFDVLQQGIGMDGPINVRLGILGEIYSLGVASPLEVEYSVLVPAVFVVPDESAMRVGREGSLAGAGQPEEQRRIPIPPDVRRAVHGKVPGHGEPIIHEGEYALLVLSSVPRPEDDRLLLLDVEYHRDVGM